MLCGYQGWFRCEGDGTGQGWHHYGTAQRKFEPGHAGIDLWPDLSELGKDERYATPFRHADGRVAEVFSSVNPTTVRRHFRWMREYGIDGVFLQRFGVSTLNSNMKSSMNQLLRQVRESAHAEKRKWALMYDLSGLKPELFRCVMDDWLELQHTQLMQSGDAAYLRAADKPLVALWGLGFSDRAPSLTEWEKLLHFFRAQGCTIMVGVPSGWRTLERDAISDPKLLDILLLADIISPWSVGRFGKPEEATARVERLIKPDIAWCRERGKGYLPVVFPGFSWQNLQKSRGREQKSDAIPRLGGKFLWSQAVAAQQAGAEALYVAMFDELDEGTAIFKVTADPPIGVSRFVSEPGLKSDHYLWLTGEMGRLMRRENIKIDFPNRDKVSTLPAK